MAKSDLLKEAIADAKAVKETALANAKIALQEAFHPRIKSMLENELMSELEDEELGAEEPMADPMDDPMADPMANDGDGMGDAGEPMDVGDIEIDTDMDGEIDFTGDIMSKPGAEAVEDEMVDDEEEIMDDEAPAEPMGDMEESDLGLEAIIKELEEDLNEGGYDYNEGEGHDEGVHNEEMIDEVDAGLDGTGFDEVMNESQSIDELIEAILAEEEDDKKKTEEKEELTSNSKNERDCVTANKQLKKEIAEAYDTVSHLKSVINEVNLLNAKLLYTNKLFRNFDLNEGQKMKVIENFDRAANTREAKLVFSTLAESFQKPSRGKRKVVKESKSLASKPVATTAPSKQTTQVLSEGFEQANRWKKLAGLIK